MPLSNNHLPLYFQLKSYIVNQISTGEWKAGDKIPSEAEFCEQFSISRTTIRQAINELVIQGKLIRSAGRGTFVSKYRIEQPSFFLNFSQDMKLRGLTPSTKVLQIESIPITPYLSKIMHLDETDKVVFIKRQRYADNRIISVESCYLPYFKYASILDEDIANQSLSELMMRKFNSKPVRSFHSIASIGCPTAEAEILEVKQGSPILFISGINFDENDFLFEYYHTFIRGDRFTYNVEINNQEYKHRFESQEKTV